MTAPVSAAPTQCQPNERVVFSCALANAKVVSVCLISGNKPTNNELSYRFGKARQPEFSFPSARADSAARFRYAHYFRYQTDRTELSFENDGASYAVYDYYEGDGRPRFARGVRVTAGGAERALTCKGPVISRLEELSDFVPCDTQNALASCR
jgi:hypothetical protein